MASPGKAAAPKAPPKNEAQSYNVRLKEDVKSMRDNFEEIIRLSHVNEDDQEYKGEMHDNEIQVRGANIVRAAESLMKSVSDLKDHVVINDFCYINYELKKLEMDVKTAVKNIDQTLSFVLSDMIQNLDELEEEYYMSSYPDPPDNRFAKMNLQKD